MLEGKVAIVTGGTRGLGDAISKRFTAEGAHVFYTGRYTCDGRLPMAIRDYTAMVMEMHGRIDILVNNAAILGPVGLLEDNKWHEWVETVETNLFGAVYFASTVLPVMKKQGGGKIINIAGGGASGPLPRRTAYACSKVALVRFTESLAEELKDSNIDVNALAPGPMNTAMLDDILDAGPERLGSKEYEDHLALKNEKGSMEKAVDLCAYLASESSSGLTGRFLSARHDKWPFTEMEKQAIQGDNLYVLRRTI